MNPDRALRILVFAPQSTALVDGGVRRQMLETVNGIRSLGHHVEIAGPAHLSRPDRADVAHLFAASPESLATARLLSSARTPLVVSPVLYISRPAPTIRRTLSLLDRLTGIGLPIRTELQMKRDVCAAADRLAPNTTAEADLISAGFSIPRRRLRVVPNGVETSRFADATPDLFHARHPWRSFLLFVGDAGSPRKNLPALVKAYGRLRERRGEGMPELVIAGSIGSDPHGASCRRLIESQPGAHWIGPVSHEDPLLPSLYRSAHAFVLPSQFETPGIAAMEAALAGCRIAITRHGGTREVFGDQASYLDPSDPDSIDRAIERALEAPDPIALRKRLIREYDWLRVAEATLLVYRSAIDAHGEAQAARHDVNPESA